MSRRSVFALLSCLLAVPAAHAATPLTVGGFRFEQEVVVPGSPEVAFTAFTAETASWWDHHFSKQPKKLYFEARPGGGFWEIFDDAGHGVQHAVVNFADPPRLLRFTGPLGLTGRAIEMVHTLQFESVEGGKTKVKLEVRTFGELETSWPATLEAVWKHFLVERYLPYMEGKAKTSAKPES